MSLTDVPDFRSALLAAHQLGDLTRYDGLIYAAATRPAQTLTNAAVCRSLVFALEVYAAHDGEPHACLAGVRVSLQHTWRYQRLVVDLDQHAVNACFQLSQSPFCGDFAEDVRQLRPRLFRLVRAPAPPNPALDRTSQGEPSRS